MTTPEPVGSFALVLHSHLPWLSHHGTWPVGEEWLYQSWSSSYLPVFSVLRQLATEGRTNLVTLGMTPVLAAQLDDPYSVSEFATWLGFWTQRATNSHATVTMSCAGLATMRLVSPAGGLPTSSGTGRLAVRRPSGSWPTVALLSCLVVRPPSFPAPPRRRSGGIRFGGRAR